MSLGRARPCKYECGTILAWDNEEGYFVEPENNNQQHSRERCESLKPRTGAPPRPSIQVKEAVNQDINFAILQELRKHTHLLQKIAGVEE